MPQLKTSNNLYKFITVKLCHPMRICVEDLAHWSFNDWYGTYHAIHTYHIIKSDDKVKIRYENDYWNVGIINKYGKNS